MLGDGVGEMEKMLGWEPGWSWEMGMGRSGMVVESTVE